MSNCYQILPIFPWTIKKFDCFSHSIVSDYLLWNSVCRNDIWRVKLFPIYFVWIISTSNPFNFFFCWCFNFHYSSFSGETNKINLNPRNIYFSIFQSHVYIFLSSSCRVIRVRPVSVLEFDRLTSSFLVDVDDLPFHHQLVEDIFVIRCWNSSSKTIHAPI